MANQDFLESKGGQDLIEYSLLLAFIALVAAAAYLSIGSSTNVIWSVVNSRLGAANQAPS